MGQYHRLFCPQAGTHIEPHPIGSGLKAGEHINSGTLPAAFAYLCATGLGSHPRDLPWAGPGDWAGRVVLEIGDYAEPGDLGGHAPALGHDEPTLYANASSSPALPGEPARRRKSTKSLSEALIPVIERVLSLRASDLDAEGNSRKESGWRDFLPVIREGNDWALVRATDPKEREWEEGYYERIGAFKMPLWKRPPVPFGSARSGLPTAPDQVPDHKNGPGSPCLWVNPDRGEYVDPARLDPAPDLVGVMTGRSAAGVLAMLFHPETRGGGDLSGTDPVAPVGRWRGDRIALIGPGGIRLRPGGHLGPDQVRKNFRDITDTLRLFDHSDTIFSDRYNPEIDNADPGQLAPETIVRLMGYILPGLQVEGGPAPQEVLKTLEMKAAPPRRIDISLDGRAETLHLAPELLLKTPAGAVFRLPPEIQRKALAFLDSLPERELTWSLRGDRPVLARAGLTEQGFAGLSAHELARILGLGREEA